MKKHILTLIFTLSIFFVFAQVGINTTSPNAQLEIKASNQATPANTDGLLIPVIDEFPVSSPGVNQDGMMVFVTGNGSATRGLYYWNNITSSWATLSLGWDRAGNAGTVAGTDFIGTTDNVDLVFKTNNFERMRLTSVGHLRLGYGANNGNTIIGFDAGGNTNPFLGFNTALGFRSIENMTNNVHNNVALGANSLEACTSCNDNVAIGRAAMWNATWPSQNTVVGAYAMVSNDNNANTAFGYGAGFNATGEYNVFLGRAAGFNETGSHRLYIENDGGSTPLIGGDFANNRVGINRSIGALTNTFEVGGTASNATGVWDVNSDRRLKTNINPIDGKHALELITKMRGITFEWDDEVTGYDRPTGQQYGFIAQEIMEVFPQNVSKDALGYYQTSYGKYDPLIIEAIQELGKKVEERDRKIGAQEQEIKLLNARLEKLEKLFESDNTVLVYSKFKSN